MLAKRIALWDEMIDSAERELAKVTLARRRSLPDVETTETEDEAQAQMTLAREHLAAMKEANTLFESVAAHLDEADKATLTAAVEILSDVDMCGPTGWLRC